MVCAGDLEVRNKPKAPFRRWQTYISTAEDHTVQLQHLRFVSDLLSKLPFILNRFAISYEPPNALVPPAFFG